MYTLISILIVVASVLMILVVLVQNSKGGGLASGFASSGQIMGVRKTSDFLEKMTWGLAIALFALSVLATFSLPKHSGVQDNSAIQEKIDNTAAPAEGAPFAPAPADGSEGTTEEPAN